MRAACGDADATLSRHEGCMVRAPDIVNARDPAAAALGGAISNLGRLYANVPARRARVVFSDTVAMRLVPARRGDSSGGRGAAQLWQE